MSKQLEDTIMRFRLAGAHIHDFSGHDGEWATCMHGYCMADRKGIAHAEKLLKRLVRPIRRKKGAKR